jgi:hypothetical protein
MIESFSFFLTTFLGICQPWKTREIKSLRHKKSSYHYWSCPRSTPSFVNSYNIMHRESKNVDDGIYFIKKYNSSVCTLALHFFLFFFYFFLFLPIISLLSQETDTRVPSNRDEESLDIALRGEELTALARQYI